LHVLALCVAKIEYLTLFCSVSNIDVKISLYYCYYYYYF